MLYSLIAAVALTGETSHPSNSFYAAGAPVEVTFELSGLSAGERRRLEVSVADEGDRKLKSFADDVVADDAGCWRKTYRMPADRLGFYRVRAKAGDVELPKVGSRPKGTLTYAVVHDPAKRPFVAEEDSFFGMFGNPHGAADLMPWLGTHQRINGGSPATSDKEYARESARRERFPVYGVIGAARLAWDVAPHIQDPETRKKIKGAWPWDLVDTPEGEALYREALTALAKDAVKRPWPHSKRRIYEVFWEPDLTMKNPEHFVKTAQIAYETLHAADPEALVAAPTFAGTGTGVLLRRCLDAGLGKFMDVFSIHPYTAYPPESVNFAQKLRAMRAMVREAKGRDVPMVATESGWTVAGHPEFEFKQLNGIVASHLTTLGEGFLFHNPFHGFDCSTKNNPDGDYGLSYNLLYPKVIWETNKVSPRPSSAGISAASWILDGKRPTCAIEWFSATSKGYAYADRDDNCVIAMWEWTGSGETVRLPVGRDAIDVADIMGNVRRVKTDKGELELKLQPSAQYVLGPDPKIWGREAQRKLRWSERKFMSEEDSAPVAVASVTPSCADGAFAVRTELENRTDKVVKGVVETHIRDVPGSASRRSFTLNPNATASGRAPLPAFSPRPFARHVVETRVIVDGCRVAEKETPVNFMTAERVEVQPGKSPFAAWRSQQRIALDMPVTRRPEFHHGPKDQSATAAFGWCDEYLLIDLVVQDDFFMQPTNGVSTWAGDSVQVALAHTGLERESGNGYADVVAEAKTETTFAMTPVGPEAYRTGTWDWKNLPVGRRGEGWISQASLPYDVTVVTNASGGATIHYQIAAPWKWMRYAKTPRPGTDIRFALSIGDLDPDHSIISAIEVFVLKTPRKFGHLVLADGASRTAVDAPAGAVEVATIGQSQPAGTEPVPWTGCDWVAEDAAGNVYFPQDWMVRAGTTDAVKGKKPEGVAMPDLNPRICNPPAWCAAGWAKEWKSFTLDSKARVVRGTKRGGGDDGEIAFGYDGKIGASAKVVSVGVLAETGDLLLGTTYPDDKVYRFGVDGREVRDSLWPAPVTAEFFGYAEGRTWAIGNGATALLTRPGRQRTAIGRGEHQVRAIAGSAKAGYWLATSQGALYFAPADMAHPARRVGGIGAVTALGLNGDGRIVIANGYRAYGAWVGDFPDERLDCNLLSWLIGSRWSGCTTAIDVDEKGVFYLHDTKDGKKWGFDPRVTAWTQRHLRRFPVDGREIKGTAEDPAWKLPPGAKAVARCGEYVAAWYPKAKAIKIFQIADQVGD